MSRKTRRSRRGPALVLVVLLVTAGGLVLWTRSGDTAASAADTTAAPPSRSVPWSEPAPSQPAVSEPTPSEGTDEPVVEEPTEAPAEETSEAAPAEPEVEETGGPAPVGVSLTYTGYDPGGPAVVAGGYAADVVELDATCTLVLRRDGVELRGEALGSPNVATTDCGEVRVGGDALTSGTWEAVLSYTSGTSVGQSASVEVEVP